MPSQRDTASRISDSPSHKDQLEKKIRADAEGLALAPQSQGNDRPASAEIRLSQKRKWFLLLIFSVAQYLDLASYSGLVSASSCVWDIELTYSFFSPNRC